MNISLEPEVIKMLLRDHQHFRQCTQKILQALDRHDQLNYKALKLEAIKIMNHLLVHFIFEDKELYPKIYISNNPKLRQLAKILCTDAVHLRAAISHYCNLYCPSQENIACIDTFVSDTKSILHNLNVRIQNEEDKLFSALQD